MGSLHGSPNLSARKLRYIYPRRVRVKERENEQLLYIFVLNGGMYSYTNSENIKISISRRSLRGGRDTRYIYAYRFDPRNALFRPTGDPRAREQASTAGPLQDLVTCKQKL